MQFHTLKVHRLVWLLAGTWLACGDSPKRPLGANCESNSQCESGLCVESVCLDPAADADGDTLTNGVEAGLGTDPMSADTDADGEDDPDEIDLAQLTNLDSDGDGKPDALESSLTDADDDCIVDERDPDDAVADPEGCSGTVGDWSCGAIYEAARVKPKSGTYRVDPDGAGPETPLTVECLMGVAEGGWTRLDAAWFAWLERAPIAPVPPREYLYLAADGGWYRTARTILPWSWQAGAPLPGVWFTEQGDVASAFDCTSGIGTSAGGGVGFGCYGPGAPSLTSVEGGAQSGDASLCRGTPACTPVAIYVRDVPCPGEGGNLFGDAGFDAFAKGRASCWRLPFAQPPTAPGAGVSADDAGAREGHAPALHAEYFDYLGSWITALEYDRAALAGHHAYLFSFWARAATPRPLTVIGGSGTGEESAIFALTPEWRQYEIGFAPAETDIGARPTILFGYVEITADVWIDDAALVDVGPFECTAPAGELLAGGAFDAGTACWIPIAWGDGQYSGRFLTDLGDAPTPAEAPSLRVDHDLPDEERGPVLAQVSAPILGGHGYELSLDARGADEILRLALATYRVNDWPLESEHALTSDWAHIVFRWDAPAELFDTSGATLQLEPVGPGPGVMWIDNVRLSDLGADPCLPEVWTTRGAVPDGEFDFGLRCWTYSAGEDTIVEPDVREAWAGERVPALSVVFGRSTQPLLVTSRPFALAAGDHVLSLRTRTTSAPLLYAQLVDTSGALVASFPVQVTQAWAPSTQAFEVKTDTTITLQLQAQGMPSSELWIDGLLIEPAR